MLTILLFAVTIIACNGVTIRQPVRNVKINTYYLYTREYQRNPFLLTEDNIATAPMDNNLITVIVVHGHAGSFSNTLNPLVKDALLYKHNLNVIVVDWSTYAQLSYTNSVAFVPIVGTSLADFINRLVVATKVSLNRLHLVGFNLGAHAVGFAGRELSGNVARITGLDPSAQQWESNLQRLRLTDARYVEIIHTDGHGLLANGIGIPLGHVDFFANGGYNQPGCLLNACSHNRAYELFAASLTHGELFGNFCTTKLQMSMNLCRGFSLELGTNDLSKFGSGIFRINTRRNYPY